MEEVWRRGKSNEQTVYETPGNSHSARQAADELLYTRLTGDSVWYDNAIRELNWATYMVDFDGKNRFPQDEPWLTDGYGDYIRHYLRAMDAIPALAPMDEDHILSSSTVIQQADYREAAKKYIYLNFDSAYLDRLKIFYRTFDPSGTERIKLTRKPASISAGMKNPEAGKPGPGKVMNGFQCSRAVC